jgi:hypothetical protein
MAGYGYLPSRYGLGYSEICGVTDGKGMGSKIRWLRLVGAYRASPAPAKQQPKKKSWSKRMEKGNKVKEMKIE